MRSVPALYSRNGLEFPKVMQALTILKNLGGGGEGMLSLYNLYSVNIIFISIYIMATRG